MAITAAASSAANHSSSTLPTISSFHYYYYPAKSSYPQVFNAILPPKHGLMPAAAPPAAVALATAAHHEVVTLEFDAAEAARAAVMSALEMDGFLAFRESEQDDDEEHRSWRNGVLMRRKRRRKRRKECLEGNLENKRVIKSVYLSPTNSGHYLTSAQEAEYTYCLKEEARIEAVRKNLEDASKEEVTLSQWAKAAGISRISLDHILCNSREAQDRITRCYKRLVVSIASSYKGKGLSFPDLIQEGTIGLIHGAKRFTPEKGYKLSTYVYWWIRQAMNRAVAKKSRLTRLPGSMSELVPKICEANAVLNRRLRKLPTCEEIARVVNKDTLTVGLTLERIREPISLDQPISAGDSMSLQEIVTGPDETTPEAIIMKRFMRRDLESLLNRLSDRELSILRLYYGLNGNTPLSFEDIGRRLKLSRERVRQISCIALAKLRETSILNDLKVFIAQVN